MQCLLCNGQFSWQPRLGQWLSLGNIHEPVICPQCASGFSHYPAPRCCGCGRHLNAGHKYCNECRQWRRQLGWNIAHRCLYPYDAAMKELMHRYKFQGDYLLRKVFQQEMTQQAKRLAADYIVPIPVTPQTMQHRGFNQVEGLFSCSLTKCITTISREKQAQSTKTREERLRTEQPFCLTESLTDLKNKQVLIVDDVYTTGRTMYHAATLFKQAGVKDVLGLSLAG